MSATAALGLLFVFVVDLIDLYFIGLLGDQNLVAAAGYAAAIGFLVIAIGIGLMIATSVRVARAVGEGKSEIARERATAAAVYSALVSIPVTVLLWLFIDPLISVMNASPEVHAHAVIFIRIILPSMPFMLLGMACNGMLRGVADAKRSMYVTLFGGILNGLLDPLFIFGFGWGFEGAAWATALSRFSIGGLGVWYVMRNHGMFIRISWAQCRNEWRALTSVALPALMTNLATPVTNIFITSVIARFGTDALAGFAIVGRIAPVAFALVFSMSGAVSPIFSQNLGAHQYKRLMQTAFFGVGFAAAVVTCTCLLLVLGNDLLIAAFGATGSAAFLITQFNYYLGFLFFFTGVQFLAQSGFNALDRPKTSTVLGWSRALFGGVLATSLGATWYGLPGAHAGQYIVGVFFGLLSFGLLIRHIRQITLHATPVRRRRYFTPFAPVLNVMFLPITDRFSARSDEWKARRRVQRRMRRMHRARRVKTHIPNRTGVDQ